MKAEKTDWQYWVECMRLRYGDQAPVTQMAYGEAEIAAPNPHDLPAAPDPYAPHSPDESYRSKYDPYPGVDAIVSVEQTMTAEERAATIRKVLKADVQVPDAVKQRVEQFRQKEAARLRAYRARKKGKG